MNAYRQLAEGGGYTLPFLVHLYTPDGSMHIYLVNDNAGIMYGGHLYEPSSFTYSPNSDGDTTFSVELVEHDNIIDLLERSYYFNVEAVGILNGGEVEEIGQYRNKYGEATWDGTSLNLTLHKDDRGGMTFPALIFNSYNNRGNA